MAEAQKKSGLRQRNMEHYGLCKGCYLPCGLQQGGTSVCTSSQTGMRS